MNYFITLIFISPLANAIISSFFINKAKNYYLTFLSTSLLFISLTSSIFIFDGYGGAIDINFYKFLTIKSWSFYYGIHIDKFNIVFMIFINLFFCVLQIISLYLLRREYNLFLSQINLFLFFTLLLLSVKNFILFFIILSILNYLSLRISINFTTIKAKDLYYKFLISDILLFLAIFINKDFYITDFSFNLKYLNLIYLLLSMSFYIRILKIYNRVQIGLLPIYLVNFTTFIYLIVRLNFFERFDTFFALLFLISMFYFAYKTLNDTFLPSIKSFLLMNFISSLIDLSLSRSHLSGAEVLIFFLFCNLILIILLILNHCIKKSFDIFNILQIYKRLPVVIILFLSLISINLFPFGIFFIKARFFNTLLSDRFHMFVFLVSQILIIQVTLLLLYKIFHPKKAEFYIKKTYTSLNLCLLGFGVFTLFLGNFSFYFIKNSTYNALAYGVFMLLNLIVFIFMPKNLKTLSIKFIDTKSTNLSLLKISKHIQKSPNFTYKAQMLVRILWFKFLKLINYIENIFH